MTTYAELLEAYLAQPSGDSLKALRDAIQQAPNFRPDLDVAQIAAPMMQQHAYTELIASLHSMMPGAMFSPSAHAALADAFRGAGQYVQAEREEALAEAALDSIRSTGRGSNDEPWTVLRLGDAYDLVYASGKTPRSQVSVGRLERIVCTDGTVWFFDPSEALARHR
ncbi:MAG: DUF4919 domain-containing protein [Nocardioides sp.]|nr:DUF4919 domain-containing protein [Nocardioides sp.]